MANIVDTIAYPDHNIDPKKKGKDWILQFGKAIWSSWSRGMATGSIFAAKADRYAEIADYAMGKQSITKYQAQLLPEEDVDDSWTKIDWTPMANGMILRNIAVAKLQKAGYNILATAINPEAKDAQDDEYNNQRIKIMMREAMQQQAPQLAGHPMFKQMPGEAEDLESLQMEYDHNPKFVRSKDIEESVQLVFYENEMQKILDQVAVSMVDNGVGVIKEGLDENNKVIYRYVYPEMFGCSFTKDPDFSDITHAFELIHVKLSDLKKYFSTDEIETLRGKIAGKYGNPTTFGLNVAENNGYDIFKCPVVDFEFVSYDKRVTEENRDKQGNLQISKTNPANEAKGGRYTSKTWEVRYRGKWVVDTNLIYDYGIAPNLPRTAGIATMAKTKLSYYVSAANFNNMRATGLTEAMIPIIDDLCMAVYRLRSFRNQMVPNGFDIDLGAIEAVALGKGGTKMTPMEVIEFFMQKGILISRRSGISMDQNVNYKAINSIETNQAQNLAAIYNDIIASKQALRDITGLNELTDGSTPGERTGKTIAQLANESTNNALWYLIKARKNLVEKCAKGCVQQLQVALKRGPYDGYNKNAGRWITVPKSIQDYDYDIMIEDKPSDDQKEVLYQMFQKDIAAGNLDTSDVITITNTQNIKQAQILLAFKVKTNKAKMQQAAQANIQATAQANMQSTTMIEQVKDHFAEEQFKRDMLKISLEKSWEFEIQGLKIGQANQAVETKAATEILTASMGGEQAAAPGEPQMEAAPEQEPQMMEAQ